jgi:hypothetical protein
MFLAAVMALVLAPVACGGAPKTLQVIYNSNPQGMTFICYPGDFGSEIHLDRIEAKGKYPTLEDKILVQAQCTDKELLVNIYPKGYLKRSVQEKP